MVDDSPIQAIQVEIQGLVQGVGFRPFIYRSCMSLLLRGWVENNTRGVQIHAEGPPTALDRLLIKIREEAPTGSIIEEIRTHPVAPLGLMDFQVKASVPGNGANTARFPPDRVICKQCISDIWDPLNRRYQYAFTTCVACGPRYSILRALPYDRVLTTMDSFPLCTDCEKEYRNPGNRRFHAEPIACPRCGPHVFLADQKEMQAIRRAAQLLAQGAILAMKGLGGYQLLARADSSAVIRELRRRKQRPTKPFAVMVRSLEEARSIGIFNEREAQCLQSPGGPIVLVDKRETDSLAEEIAPACRQIGLLLPTTPLHILLLSLCDFPVVATSGNKRDEPIAISAEEAEKDLFNIADHFLHHDRAIERRMDDSVVKVIADVEMVIRSARGFAPTPLDNLEKWIERKFAKAARSPVPIIAVGAQQKNAQAIWTGSQAILGAHLGDLDHPKTMQAFHDHFQRFPGDYGCEVRHLAADLHPDYASTRHALSTGLPLTRVQHHHAHAVASMIEHNLLEEEVLAFCWDGTGLGTDGTIWGGEILLAKMGSFRRVGSLLPFHMPGGEMAIHEINRMALALVRQAMGGDLSHYPIHEWLDISPTEEAHLSQILKKEIHCIRTTSMGRLFDGVASLALGIHRVSHEGEAANFLESIAGGESTDPYPMPLIEVDGFLYLDWRPMIRAMLTDRLERRSASLISTRFHQGLAFAACEVASRFPEMKVVLGGGCFINMPLVCNMLKLSQEAGKSLFFPSRIPCGDGGIAAGQLAIALANQLPQKHQI